MAMRFPWRTFVFLLTILTLPTGTASAAESQWWTANTAADHARAEAVGVRVDAQGVLRLAPRTTISTTDSLTVAWAAVVLRDGSVAVAGDRGRVLRWSAARGWTVWARLGPGPVLALAADGDGVIAGTGPRGRVLRVAANGDTTLLADTGERYVWGIAPAPDGWWFATGTRGRVLRWRAGRTSIALDTEEGNLVSMTGDGRGGVYVGGDARGRVYHVPADGAARTLFDAPEDEVRAVARSTDGHVWALALAAAATTDDEDREEGPRPVRTAPSDGRAVLYRITPEGQATTWWTSPQPVGYALLDTPEGPLVGTGTRAGVQRVERIQGASLLWAPAAAQVTALANGSEGTVYAVTSNPVSLARIGPDVGREGTLTSAVQDARRFSRFGRVVAESAGSVTFETRTGNGAEPDTTWSRWESVRGDGGIVSPSARFLQWRVRLTSADARVDEVSISRREANLPPRVEDLSVAAQGRDFREGGMSSRTESVTQTLPSGQKVEYSATIPAGGKALREMPLWARGLRTMQWRGVDPNGDVLRYAVEVRREPEGPWIRIARDLEVSLLTWNTDTFGDGRYRVRVIASDEEGNPIGEGLTGESWSEAFRVDNTAPEVLTLEAVHTKDGVRVTGRARDGQGWLLRLDLSTDDGPWRPVSPTGGIADTGTLEFAVTLPRLEPGAHLVSLRAVDAAGNSATRAVQVTVPVRR